VTPCSFAHKGRQATGRGTSQTKPKRHLNQFIRRPVGTPLLKKINEPCLLIFASLKAPI
jgi:hypothetical protein